MCARLPGATNRKSCTCMCQLYRRGGMSLQLSPASTHYAASRIMGHNCIAQNLSLRPPSRLGLSIWRDCADGVHAYMTYIQICECRFARDFASTIQNGVTLGSYCVYILHIIKIFRCHSVCRYSTAGRSQISPR
jgi:hypothetical protein